MAESPKISVITPIYNVARYLPQCLDSLEAQTLKEIEFICVNDGSTDESLSILQAYAECDERFVIIDKPNSGYGASMNAGLKTARGEYIGIVESDDFIDANAFEFLYGLAASNGSPDIVKANHYRYKSSSGDSFLENYPEELCGKVLTPLEEPGIRVINSIPAIWAAIYRTEFLRDNGICFLETPGASFQDTGFVFKSWLAADSFLLCHSAFLHYRVDNASSSVKDKQKAYYVCDEFASIESFLSERPERANKLMPHIIAKKCATYEWNLKRIDYSLRPDFLRRYRDEFDQARQDGVLDKALFSEAQWTNLTRLLDQSDSVLIEAQIDSAIQGNVKISVVVPVYNAMPFLKGTLNSIKRQTLKEIEVLIVNDGSSDGSKEYIEEFSAKDSRFKLFNQENAGVSAARNLALEHINGEYVAFCDADDLLPITAYEAMYRAAKIKDADVVVGREDEFTLTSKAVYARSEWLAKKKRISKYDVDFNWNFSLCNKLFRARIIHEHELRFTDEVITEDGIFLCKYIRYANRMTGCPQCVYRYRRHHFFENHSATQRIDSKAIASYFNSMETVKQLREQCMEYDIEQLSRGGGSKLLIDRVRAESAIACEDVDYRALSTAIERYYRWLWRMDVESLGYLIDRLDSLREGSVYPDHWDDICDYNTDLRLDEGFKTQEEFSKRLFISIIITPQEDEELFMNHVESVFLQRFPSFELLIPAICKKWTPEQVEKLPNVHFIDANTRSEMINRSLEVASGSYVNILEDRIYHAGNTLREMWKALSSSHADFVCVKLDGITRKKKSKSLVSSELLYSAEFASSPSIRTKYHALDSSANNKLFRKDALVQIGPLSDNPNQDMKAAFETLSFIKLPKVSMACFEGDSFFVKRVSEPVKTSYKLFYRWRDKHPFTSAKEVKLPTAKKSKSQVLFCSNRENNRLSTSMQLVYDALPGVNKVVFSEPLPHSNEYMEKLNRAIVQSKVIVTDDYIHPLAEIELRDDQSVIQLWHACGALKKFGLDNIACNIKRERSIHKQYDAVMVSDESVRGVYAHAFGISKATVKALGVPRTDKLLDVKSISQARERVYGKHPELKGKTVILYCPTFREHDGRQSRWESKIDWQKLDAALSDDQVFIVKEHPLEISEISPKGAFKHIKAGAEASTDDLLTVADLLVTDCSSIVFDFSLLNKPMVFYFPDFDLFNRDYYIDFPEGVGADIERTDEELIQAIQDALANPEQYLVPSIRKGMMSACDGHSTERIASYVLGKLNG